MRISASFHQSSRRDNPSSDTARVAIKKISFNPTSRRSSHDPADGAPSSQRSAEHPASWHRFSAPTGTRDRRGPSVAVRGKPTVHTDRPSGRTPSVDTATQRPAAPQGDTWRDREETARIAGNSQPGGRFRRWWQVLGSNQRRLSRRFYRPNQRPTPHSP